MTAIYAENGARRGTARRGGAGLGTARHGEAGKAGRLADSRVRVPGAHAET